MSVVLQVHDVEKIVIKKRHYEKDETCHEFVTVRIGTKMRDGSDGPSVDLFMNRPALCVRTGGGSVIERTIEVARPVENRSPEEIGNSFDRGHGEGPGQ